MKHNAFFLMAGLSLLLTCPAPAPATPPQPELLQMIQSGLIPPPYAYEHSVALHQMGVDAPMGIGLSGDGLDVYNFNSIVIPVDFNDQPGITIPISYDQLIFIQIPGSVWDYFQEVSYGQFQLVTLTPPSAIGWLRMPQLYPYYVNGQNGFGPYPNNAQRLVENAVAAADPMVNFAQFDHDGNGSVDGLIVIHSGTDGAWSGNNNDIWSHAWSLPAPFWTNDGVYVSTYAMVPEFYAVPGDLTPGVICHEMGHSVLGLPDLYDTDYTSFGLGYWSLMSFGMWNGPMLMGGSPAHLDAWSRIKATFIAPENVVWDWMGFPFIPTEQAPIIFRIWTNGAYGNQYFLTENRQPIGFDAWLPAHGLFIYHIDDAVQTWNNNEWFPGHVNFGHYRVALEQSDGMWNLEQNINCGDPGDPYPGAPWNPVFNAASVPDSKNYAGGNTNVTINIVAYAPPIVTTNWIIGIPPPVNPLVQVWMSPNNAPVFVPVNGGQFSFTVTIANWLAQQRTGQMWFNAILPNGNPYFIRVQNITLQPGVIWNNPNMLQFVPAMAPPGPYHYICNVGMYPNFIATSSQFWFVKQALVATSDPEIENWNLLGFDETGTTTQGDAPSLTTDPLPRSFTVGNPWPNPFNAQTRLSVTLPASSRLHAAVYNTLGQRVATLADGVYSPGEHQLTFDAGDLSSGMYFAVVQNGAASRTLKLMLMK